MFCKKEIFGNEKHTEDMNVTDPVLFMESISYAVVDSATLHSPTSQIRALRVLIGAHKQYTNLFLKCNLRVGSHASATDLFYHFADLMI